MPYALSDDIRRYFERPGKLDRLGEIFGVEVYPDGLGCGFYGCVYETDSPFVIKITSDIDEGPMWERLRQLQAAGEVDAGLPKIERVIQVDPEAGQLKTFTVYATLREDVAPAPPWVSSKDFESILSDYSVEARRGPLDEQRLFELADAVSEYRPESKELGDLLYRLAELGIPPADLHGGNIGQRSDADFGEPGQLLFIDPGTKSVEQKVSERFAANVVRKLGRPSIEGVDMSRLPKAPSPRRISGHAPARRSPEERRLVRRIVEEYEEEERPFDPAVPPESYARPHHFAVNNSLRPLRGGALWNIRWVGVTKNQTTGEPERWQRMVTVQAQSKDAAVGRAMIIAQNEYGDEAVSSVEAKESRSATGPAHHTTYRLRENSGALSDPSDEGEVVEWPLSEEDQRALSEWIAPRYLSGEILWKGWDEESQTIPVDEAIAAFIATAGDGGNIGTVPLAGGTLSGRIEELWEAVGAWEYKDAARAYAAGEYEDPYAALGEVDGFEGNARCPVGTEVQTLIFDREVFNKTEAKRWAKENDFSATKVDETRDSYRIRQKDPRRFKKTGFRTIELADGVKAVVGCPK